MKYGHKFDVHLHTCTSTLLSQLYTQIIKRCASLHLIIIIPRIATVNINFRLVQSTKTFQGRIQKGVNYCAWPTSHVCGTYAYRSDLFSAHPNTSSLMAVSKLLDLLRCRSFTCVHVCTCIILTHDCVLFTKYHT